MHLLDYAVLVGYFAIMIAIGIYSSRMIKAQEDFFMGGRSFGKLLQTFAAFGAGTGSSDPVNTGRTTFTSGMSGMWSVMYWLFVTPFYWIAGVWYRRMRHLTLGDWFVERYESRAMGAAYCLFGIMFFVFYGSMLFSAIGKVAAPLIGTGDFILGGASYGIEYLLVPIIGVLVLAYGILGGLRAAYFTDLIQGLCIIVLSIILVPYGLNALVDKFGDPEKQQTMIDGFRIMHEQLPEQQFTIVGSNSSSEFPLHRILAVVIINLIGIVVQPHFIATGGGSAKTENTARVGLVVGNFLKRFCTVGWVLTALIAAALYAGHPELVADPDKTWGVASRELLGPGLTGLMLACLLAALMSSVDAYMIVGSGLVVRNIYAAYINPNASEKQYVRVGRMTGVIVVAGAVLVSLSVMDVFKQLQLTWVFPVLFAAPFWVGMYWRRATAAAAWLTVIFCAAAFFLIPALAPHYVEGLRTNPDYLKSTDLVQTTVVRQAAPSDVARRNAAIALWKQNPTSGEQPQPLELNQSFSTVTTRGGQGIFWPGGVQPVDANGKLRTDLDPQPVGQPRQVDAETTEITLQYPAGTQFQGFGNFKLDFLIYQYLNIDLSSKDDATLATLELPPKIIAPFLVMILFSLITPRNSREGLDRYYSKMKTPVVPDVEQDRKNLEQAYENRAQLEQRKLFPHSSFEFQKPTAVDVIGFVLCVITCFGVIGLAVWIASIGANGT